ncbi:MAG: ArsR/SmtB family transcription factor [Candidatus Xenobiia bacterium LiM19]
MQKTLTITKALADGNRLRVLIALTAIDELCLCQITEMLKLSPATVSRHMSVLHNAHLVKSRKDSRWVYYRLSNTFPPSLLQWLKESLAQSEESASDEKRLKCIIAIGLDALCKTIKSKKGCQAG